MNVLPKDVTVRELVNGYTDDNGVWAYGGLLNIRPEYQREFVYNETQQIAVIESIMNNLPIGQMYWVENNHDDVVTYEVLDGQQRAISIAKYVDGRFCIPSYHGDLFYEQLDYEQKQRLMDYKLLLYNCDGTTSEKLSYFKTINMVGEKLTDQELRNAVYSGQWLTHARRFFSKYNCQAKNIGGDYVKGKPIRQTFLETVLSWISENNIDGYMAQHQRDTDANDLWLYFTNVINWVKTYFPEYRKEMKSVQWGILYNKYHDTKINADVLEDEIQKLMMDENVTKKSGIYSYVLTRNEKDLSIRAFNATLKREVYERQGGKCVHCKNTDNEDKKWTIDEMQADHIVAWVNGGKTISDNCQMLCNRHNQIKSNS